MHSANEIIEFNGKTVKVFNNDVEQALRVLKRRLRDDNFALLLQRHEYYRKPSEIKKDRRHKARRRSNNLDD